MKRAAGCLWVIVPALLLFVMLPAGLREYHYVDLDTARTKVEHSFFGGVYLRRYHPVWDIQVFGVEDDEPSGNWARNRKADDDYWYTGIRSDRTYSRALNAIRQASVASDMIQASDAAKRELASHLNGLLPL
ncbi:MAG: hypothetical protein AAGD00_02795 [Planctomycetota bacterium]